MLNSNNKQINIKMNSNQLTNYPPNNNNPSYLTPPNSARYNLRHPKNRLNDQLKDDDYVTKKTDQQFYEGLKNYDTICYNGDGRPFLLKNKNWYYNLPCILLLNALVGMVLFVYLSNTSVQKSQKFSQLYQNTGDPITFIIVNIVVLICINIFYFLTQFMNPGIYNLSQITQETYEKENGKFYCIRCNGYRTGQMEHCPDCQVCLKNLDHHCGFFNKCIAGHQTYAFYGFLASVFIGFLSLLVTLTSSVWI